MFLKTTTSKKILTIFTITVAILIIFSMQYNSEPFTNAIKIIRDKNFSKCPLLFDYSIKILNEKPNSLETMYLLKNLIVFLRDEKAIEHFEPIYDKYDLGNISSIGNVNESTGEKLMISILLGAGIEKPTTGRCTHEFEVTSRKGEMFLNEISKNCNDKNYKAIVELLEIALGSETNNFNSKNVDEFIIRYPNHKFIPELNLLKLYDHFEENASKDVYNSMISEALKYAKEYQDIITPYGYSFADEYYYLVCVLYFKINDLKKSNEYLSKLIKDNYDKSKIDIMSQKLDYFK